MDAIQATPDAGDHTQREEAPTAHADQLREDPLITPRTNYSRSVLPNYQPEVSQYAPHSSYPYRNDTFVSEVARNIRDAASELGLLATPSLRAHTRRTFRLMRTLRFHIIVMILATVLLIFGRWWGALLLFAYAIAIYIATFVMHAALSRDDHDD